MHYVVGSTTEAKAELLPRCACLAKVPHAHLYAQGSVARQGCSLDPLMMVKPEAFWELPSPASIKTESVAAVAIADNSDDGDNDE